MDGVSLTVNACQGNTFTVNIIPHTAQETTLAALKVGDRVNLETDIIGKYVARLLGQDGPRRRGGHPGTAGPARVFVSAAVSSEQ